MTNRKDYTGKIVYMGIDVHKKSYCCASVCENEYIRTDSMTASPEGLLSYMKKYFPGAIIKSAYEAGFSGFNLHRYLSAHGIDNIVVHAAAIEVSSRDRVKTDKRDAKKIAIQLSAQRLEGIYIPSIEQEAKRNVSRLRATVKKERNRAGARLKSLLSTQGLIHSSDDTKVSKKWIEEMLLTIEQGNYHPSFCYTVNSFAKEWNRLALQVKEIEKELSIQAMNDKELYAIYTSVPGIGLIHATQLINELGDMSQFSNEHKIFSYVGLTPSEYSSGEHTRQGHITRQGRSVLRNILIEAAWVAIARDQGLREIYKRLSLTGSGKRAIVGIARRLIGRIRSCVKNGTLYRIHPPKEEVTL